MKVLQYLLTKFDRLTVLTYQIAEKNFLDKLFELLLIFLGDDITSVCLIKKYMTF